jgi:peptidoglycan L-alanyl-D-glutamate endopeptidase CwlK
VAVVSSRKIEDLVPALQEKFKLFEAHCHSQGMDFIVTCTTRSIEEQAALVKEGKSKTMNSKHLTGKAFDIAVLKNGKVSWNFDDYKLFGAIGKDIGLTWGGDFHGFPDGPHFQIGG